MSDSENLSRGTPLHHGDAHHSDARRGGYPPSGPMPAGTGGRPPVDFSPPAAARPTPSSYTTARYGGPPQYQAPPSQHPLGTSETRPRRGIGRWVVTGLIGIVVIAAAVGGGMYYSAQADTAAVTQVEQSIGAVTTVTVASTEQIRRAQDQYDALSPELQARVNNHEVLLAAHEELAAQMDQVVLAQSAVDAWREHEICGLAYSAESKYEKLDADQQALIEGGADLTDAISECDAEAKARRAQEDRDIAARKAQRSAAEEDRKHNLIEISGNWYEEVPQYAGPGCLYWVAPTFTNISNKVINYVWFDVSFINRVGHLADDINGIYTHTLRIVGPVKRGETHDETEYGFDLVYSCGEVTGLQIESVTIEYNNDAWETIDGSYLQYTGPWESAKEE